MNFVAVQMLIGDRAKYLGLIFAVAFSTFLMSHQSTIFAGIMDRTTSQIKDIKDAESEFFTQLPALFIERRYSWTFTTPQVQDFQMVNDNNQLVDRTWIKTH